MRIRIAKEFQWEMSHRLPFHKGDCKNIHGHTYKVRVEIEGDTDANGMIMDYFDMANIMNPVIHKLDHAFLVDSSDSIMLDFLTSNNFKHVVINKTTTAENIAAYILDIITPSFQQYKNIDILKIRFNETADVFAELEKKL